MTAVMPMGSERRIRIIRRIHSRHWSVPVANAIGLEVAGAVASHPAAAGAVARWSAPHRAVDDTMPTPRVYIVRRLLVLLCTAALAWAGWSVAVPRHAQSATGAIPMVTYTVRPGDTLWLYASEVTPRGGDVSDTVHELKVLNNLQSSALQPGQTLLVPAQ